MIGFTASGQNVGGAQNSFNCYSVQWQPAARAETQWRYQIPEIIRGGSSDASVLILDSILRYFVCFQLADNGSLYQ